MKGFWKKVGFTCSLYIILFTYTYILINAKSIHIFFESFHAVIFISWYYLLYLLAFVNLFMFLIAFDLCKISIIMGNLYEFCCYMIFDQYFIKWFLYQLLYIQNINLNKLLRRLEIHGVVIIFASSIENLYFKNLFFE